MLLLLLLPVLLLLLLCRVALPCMRLLLLVGRGRRGHHDVTSSCACSCSHGSATSSRASCRVPACCHGWLPMLPLLLLLWPAHHGP
jgi:hypothetical protein